ncbi:PREDICTED: uncharacterized protein LOC108373559 isoform X1 [Rhagoletis zephyria]|uniref:uncharacterized protein LOC108373559 isoform X1 n=1 Tax=Rhagoletis zephyria TaxID=28612 RepID=UPI0008113181|nr:PREDICTED: uncharacterized protein LOC108373559 isoform X1 [Rhagoletis zephyria]
MVEFWGIFVVFSACAAIQLTESRYHDANASSDVSDPDCSASEELRAILNGIDDNSEDRSDSRRRVPTNPRKTNSLDLTEHAGIDPRRGEESSIEQDEVTSTSTTPPTTTTKVSKHKTKHNKKHKTSSTKPLSLTQRRQSLYAFARDGMRAYESYLVGLTRATIENILTELEVLPKKSESIREKIAEVKKALREFEKIDLENQASEFDGGEEASDIVADLNTEFNNPIDAPPALGQVLEKVGWMDLRHKLNDKVLSLMERFGKEFNTFIAALTPWERVMETALVELHRRFIRGDTNAKWSCFREFLSYYDF